ncbi:PepSY-associated TM helix domain-containing protein [Cupriavidus sp. 30B13]|uniref:PepSY-associated TM helix domain-containing protein n=1 Tax=Cupriavidus sp. 30B13 TaxID=3384241 RepID=UPI003B905B2F
MSHPSHLRQWYQVHKWTSLICTLFLLLICLTGLPLVFSEEIDTLLDGPTHYAQLPADTPPASLDGLVAEARRRHPQETVTSVFIDDDEPQVMVWMAPSWQAFTADTRSSHAVRFDARTGQMLEDGKPSTERGLRFTDWMLRLHTDLFAGLAGELFLGLMAALFVAATVSGIVLYGPFMKKLDFGTVRTGRASRLKWLDLHNLLGIVTLAWTLVVGATGVINELSTPLFALWQRTDVAAMLAPWQGQPRPGPGELAPVQAAVSRAGAAVPGKAVVSVVFPGSPFGSPFHYVIWTKGDSALTSRLFTPVLVDARSGALSGVAEMPWYLRALEVCRPLHFGDYGGTPMKVLWVLLDLITLIVLGSGLYLWFARRHANAARLERLVAAHAAAGAAPAEAGAQPARRAPMAAAPAMPRGPGAEGKP